MSAEPFNACTVSVTASPSVTLPAVCEAALAVAVTELTKGSPPVVALLVTVPLAAVPVAFDCASCPAAVVAFAVASALAPEAVAVAVAVALTLEPVETASAVAVAAPFAAPPAPAPPVAVAKPPTWFAPVIVSEAAAAPPAPPTAPP